MKFSFKDLVDVPALKKMVRANYEASGIPNGIVDAVSGEIYAGAGWQRICTDFHRKYPESGKICIESNIAMTGKISRGKPHACKCKHGLWDIGIPILCAKKHIATLFLGQFRYEEEEIDKDFFIKQADRFGFPVADYLSALDEVPIFSKDKVAMILTYNQSFAEFMSTLATDRMRYHRELSHRKKTEAKLKKAIIDDAERRRQVEKALVEKEHHYQTIFEQSPDAVMLIDPKTQKVIEFNDLSPLMLGYSREEFINLKISDYEAAENPDEVKTHIAALLAEGRGAFETRLRSSDGSVKNVLVNCRVIQVKGKKVFHCIFRDITERLEAERAQRQSEERLQAAIETIDEGFALFDAEDRLTLFNTRFLEIYGKSAEALVIGSFFEDILRDGIKKGQFGDLEGQEEAWAAERMQRHHSAASSFEQKLSDGRWVKIAEKKMKDGSTVGFRVDITDIKRSEEFARGALKEKETLLREIHHRVKNNMQVVSSLLSLQANKIDDPKILALLTEAECRVHSMALVHEILYQADNLSEINLQVYLETLSDQLRHLYTPRGMSPDFQINAREVILGIEHAVPFGLIITELITNALKYASLPGSGLKIRINAGYAAGSRIRLAISDNGPGLPPLVDPGNTKTLGLRLVAELVTEQLEGDWHLVPGAGGTCWVITWPVIHHDALM